MLHYKRLRGDRRIILNAPTFQFFMCGLAQDGTGCTQAKDGTIHLRYGDGSTESAHCPEINLGEAPSLFYVVGVVQAKARETVDA